MEVQQTKATAIMYMSLTQNIIVDFDKFPHYSDPLNIAAFIAALILIICFLLFIYSLGSHPKEDERSRKATKRTGIALAFSALLTIGLGIPAVHSNGVVSDQRYETLQEIATTKLGGPLSEVQIGYVFGARSGSRFAPRPIGVEASSGDMVYYSFLYTGDGNKYEFIEIPYEDK